MSKQRVTIFLCQGKHCHKAWGRLTDSAPGKWLKRAVEQAGLPYKLRVVETECQDHCDEAACLCCVHGSNAELVDKVRSEDDAERVLAALRVCVERDAKVASENAG